MLCHSSSYQLQKSSQSRYTMQCWWTSVNQILTSSICQVLILKTCRMYNVIGSGTSHAIYAQFMAQSAWANRCRIVCLIRGAGTRIALWFYAMMHLIRLQQPLKATIHQQKCLDLTMTNSAKGAVQDIKDENFWKCMYILLCAVFPALRALRHCDSNTPCMDKLFYLSHRTTVAIENSLDDLNDKSLFGSLKTDQKVWCKPGWLTLWHL